MQEMGWERGCLFCVVWMCKSGAADGATCSSNGSTPSAYVTVYVGGLISPHHTSLRAISAFYAMYYVYTTLNGRRLEQDRLYVNWRNHIWAEIKKKKKWPFLSPPDALDEVQMQQSYLLHAANMSRFTHHPSGECMLFIYLLIYFCRRKTCCAASLQYSSGRGQRRGHVYWLRAWFTCLNHLNGWTLAARFLSSLQFFSKEEEK